MRLRIHHTLFAGFTGVVGFLVVLIVVLVGSGLRRELRATFEGALERQLTLTESIVSTSSARDAGSLARAVSERIGYRVTIIGVDGVVLGDSHVEPGALAQVESHADRPEVREVLDGTRVVGFAERTSATVGEPLLYGARRSTLGGTPVVLRLAAPQTEIQAAVRRVQATVALTGLLAMLVALVAAYGLSRAFARPIAVLAARARDFREGDLAAAIPEGRVAELHDVAVAFNRLTQELQARLSELGRERDEMQTLIDCMAEGVVALTEDAGILRVNRAARGLLGLPEVAPYTPIADAIAHLGLREALEESVSRPEQSRELEIQGRHLLVASRVLDHGGSVTTLLDITELRRLEQVRSDFVANASHELRTPLTSIRGYAEALADDEPPEDVRRQFISSIHGNTMRLQRLVEDLLDLSRLESGGWSAVIEPVDVGEVVDEAWEMVQPRSERFVHFSVSGHAMVLGDRQGLVQVFRNLLENAVRHTDDRGLVSISITQDGPDGPASITVEDDGEGIPEAALPRIFERFYRIDSARGRYGGGTGLGLSIVRHLVTAMNGDVTAASEPGAGTKITVTLPAARSPAGAISG